MDIKDIKNKLNPMEKKKLNSLEEEAEKNYLRANFLEKERKKMLKDRSEEHTSELQSH